MTKIPYALGLHSVRDECARDLPGTLKAVAEMGYGGVEFAGYHGCAAGELRAMLDDLGLVTVGTHTWWQHVPLVGKGSDVHLPEALAYNRALGNTILVGIGDVPFPAERQDTRAGWVEHAGLYNALAERVAAEGMQVAYHNHAMEFETGIDGETVWDILYGHLNRLVLMQLDTGSAVRGGGDVLALLQRYPGRARTVHLKPYSHAGGTRPLIGDDDLPWADILRLCRTVGGTEWYIVEYESDGYPRMEAVARCLDALMAMSA